MTRKDFRKSAFICLHSTSSFSSLLQVLLSFIFSAGRSGPLQASSCNISMLVLRETLVLASEIKEEADGLSSSLLRRATTRGSVTRPGIKGLCVIAATKETPGAVAF